MKKCKYCHTVHDDSVEKCCGLKDFIQLKEEKYSEPEVDNGPELVSQPSAHELLKELCDVIDLDDLEAALPKQAIPIWIENIPYDNVREQAFNQWKDENPSLVSRIKKYLK